VSDIAEKLQDIVKRQMFIKINQMVAQNHYGFTSLSSEDEQKLRDIVTGQDPQEEMQKKVYAYLELKKTNASKWLWQRWYEGV
jgi:hypothetical protein